MRRLRVIAGDDALDAVRPHTSIEWRTLELLLNERLARVARGVAMADALRGRQHVGAILRILGEKGTVPQFRLQTLVHVSDSTLSQVLTRMENAQLIVRERDAADGRTNSVRLSDEELAGRSVGAVGAPSAHANASHHAGIVLAFPTAKVA